MKFNSAKDKTVKFYFLIKFKYEEWKLSDLPIPMKMAL